MSKFVHFMIISQILSCTLILIIYNIYNIWLVHGHDYK
jgi:hypothetical protein